MIDNLYDLSDTITAVANRALDIVAARSTSGQRYICYDDVADLITQEDFHQYMELIASELSSRKEVLEPVTLTDGELDINMGLAYCKAYAWCDGDEEIFGCSYDEWLEKEAEPVSHPLSLSRMAEIGHAAIAHILESSDVAIEDLTECVGMSLKEVNEVTGMDLRDEGAPLYEFQLTDPVQQQTFVYKDFDAALNAYRDLGRTEGKQLSVLLPSGSALGPVVDILQQENGSDLLRIRDPDPAQSQSLQQLFSDAEIKSALNRASEYVAQQVPVCFYVDSISMELPEKFADFDEALSMYQGLATNVEKNLSYATYDEKGRGHGAILLMSTGKERDRPCKLGQDALKNPKIALAHAKSVLCCYPFDEAAWKLRDEAEAKLGITDRIVDTSRDLTIGKWRTHVVPTGGHFGIHNHLINDGKPLVEFYDTSQCSQTFPEGQFVSRYHMDTLLGKDGWYHGSDGSGLCLDGNIPSWTISPEDMKQIVTYLKTFDSTGKIRPSLQDQISQAQDRQSPADPSWNPPAPQR